MLLPSSFLVILLITLVSLTIFSSLALAQDILIDSLKSLESIDSGIIKRFSFLPQEQVLGVAVFGWVQFSSNMIFGNIVTLSQSATQFNKPNNDNTVLSLAFLHFQDPKFIISCYQNSKEEITNMDLSSEEQEVHPWIFIYLGHSFTKSQQTYYKFNNINPSTIITKEVQQFESQKFFQLSAGIGLYNGVQYFNGDIVRLTIMFGDLAYRKTDFHELHIWFPETMPPCSVAFTECAYTGEGFNLCEGPSKKSVKSVLLKDSDEKVYVCLGNKQIKIKRSIECIREDNWILLSLNGEIEVESYQDNKCDG